MVNKATVVEEEVSPDEFEANAKASPEEALDEILSDNQVTLEDDFDMRPKFKKAWHIVGLKTAQIKELTERSTRPTKIGNNYQQRLDSDKYARLVIAYGVQSPNLRDPRIMQKYGLRPGMEERIADVVIEYPGFIERLATRILELSGWSENLVDMAKNS